MLRERERDRELASSTHTHTHSESIQNVADPATWKVPYELHFLLLQKNLDGWMDGWTDLTKTNPQKQ